MTNKYSTGEFAKKANVSIRTIHFYEKKGLIQPSEISEAGYRYYSDEDFATLQKVVLLKSLGFSLNEIQALSLNEEDSGYVKQSFALQLQLIHKKMEHLQMVERSIRKASDMFDAEGETDWEEMARLVRILTMEKDIVEQYKNGRNIDARILLHQQYSIAKTGWFEWVFDHLELRENQSVLEIGCGTGEFWRKNSIRLPKQCAVVLSDISHGMLEDAQKNLREVNDYFTYETMDCQYIQSENNRFDRVIANHVLFYVTDIKRALSEVRRVLRPEGKFACATYGKNHMREIEELVKTFDSRISLSQVHLYDNFGLDNGKEILEPFFDTVERYDYEDKLVVTEVTPLLSYIMSCHGNQQEYLLPRTAEFREFLQKQMEKTGSIEITKQAGVFLASYK